MFCHAAGFGFAKLPHDYVPDQPQLEFELKPLKLELELELDPLKLYGCFLNLTAAE